MKRFLLLCSVALTALFAAFLLCGWWVFDGRDSDSISVADSESPDRAGSLKGTQEEAGSIDHSSSRSLSGVRQHGDGIEVTLLILSEDGSCMPYLGSGKLSYRWIAEPVPLQRSEDVISGKAILPRPALGDLVLEALTDAQGAVALGVDGQFVPSSQDKHQATFAFSEGWAVSVVDAQTGGPVDRLTVLIASPDSWPACEPAFPPVTALPAKAGVTFGQVTLEMLTSDAVYWIGAPGYAWFAYRWNRRFHLGRRIEMRRGAHIAVRCAEEGHQGWNIRLRSTRKLGYGTILHEWTTGEPAQGVPPGTYLIEVRGTGDSQFEWADRITLGPGERKIIDLQCALEASSLTVNLVEPGPIDKYILIRLDPLGLRSDLFERIGATPQVQETPGGIALEWHELQRGEYVVQAPDGLLHPASVSARTEITISHEGGAALRDFHFVDRQSGHPLDFSSIRWSFVVGGLDAYPGLFLPESGSAQALAGLLSLELPPGELRYLAVGNAGMQYHSTKVQAGVDVYVLELDPIFQINISGNPNGQELFPSAWLADFMFTRGADPVSPESISFGFTLSGSDSFVASARIFVSGGRPDMMYVPPLADGQEPAGWVSIPADSTPVTFVLADGWQVR